MKKTKPIVEVLIGFYSCKNNGRKPVFALVRQGEEPNSESPTNINSTKVGELKEYFQRRGLEFCFLEEAREKGLIPEESKTSKLKPVYPSKRQLYAAARNRELVEKSKKNKRR